MNARYTWLKRAGLAALVAVTAVTLVLGHGRHTGRQTAGRPALPAATTAHPSAIPSKPRPGINGLEQRVRGFMEAYYRILPGDTAAVRRRRISRFTTARLAASLEFGANRKDAPRVQGHVLPEELVIASPDGPQTAVVQVPVRLYVQRQAGSTEKYITIDTRSVWIRSSGRWVVSSFN